jgi:hypothetical protein
MLGLGGMILQPLNVYLRYRRSLEPATTTLQAIEGALRGYEDGVAIPSVIKDLQSAGTIEGTFWSRLCYVDEELWVFQAREEGIKGTSYGHLARMWIPRWFWPEKPLVHPGAEHAWLTRGQETSSTAPTLPGEAYFNLGIFGVILYSIIASLIFQFFEFPIQWVVQQRRTEFGLVLFSGLFIGLRVDDWAVMLVGTFVSSLGLGLIMGLLGHWARRPPSPSEAGQEIRSREG